jgi:hypothetical protein
MINIKVNGSDVIEIKVLEKDMARAGVWFLNWNVKALPLPTRIKDKNESFKGAGIYAVSFDNYLIYIGSYLGRGGHKADFSGDVVSDRWWTHIGAITARGSKVHIAKNSLKLLESELGVSHVMINGFLNATDKIRLHKDGGDLATLRRLRFAAQRSEALFSSNTNHADILKRFDFVYVRFEALPSNENSISLMEKIEGAEIKLIKRLAPICNDKHLIRGIDPVKIDSSDVAELIQRELNAALRKST